MLKPRAPRQNNVPIKDTKRDFQRSNSKKCLKYPQDYTTTGPSVDIEIASRETLYRQISTTTLTEKAREKTPILRFYKGSSYSRILGRRLSNDDDLNFHCLWWQTCVKVRLEFKFGSFVIFLFCRVVNTEQWCYNLVPTGPCRCDWWAKVSFIIAC